MDLSLDYSIEAYDARDDTNQKCSALVVLSVIAFMFTYNVWWISCFTVAIAMLGYWCTTLPITFGKVQGVHFVSKIHRLLIIRHANDVASFTTPVF